MAKKKKTTKKTTKKKAVVRKAAPKIQEKLDAGETKETNEEVGTSLSDDSFDDNQTDLEDAIETEEEETEEEETEEEEVIEVEDLEEYKVFTMEGEYIHGEGTQQITGIYNEEFCFKEEREGVARSKIKNFLLDSRLRSKLDNYRRFRTHELISVRDATIEDVKYATLKFEDVMDMDLNRLAVFSLQENLDVSMSQYSSVEEARIRVRTAFKEGKKSRRVYDSVRKKLPGEYNPSSDVAPNAQRR